MVLAASLWATGKRHRAGRRHAAQAAPGGPPGLAVNCRPGVPAGPVRRFPRRSRRPVSRDPGRGQGPGPGGARRLHLPPSGQLVAPSSPGGGGPASPVQLLLTDPASAPWLVRVALAAEDREQAARIVTAIGEVARGNPTLAFIRASAKHAEGLLTSDVSLLQHASTELPDPWARACAVQDQGVLLAAAGRDREAIRSLEEALREYDRLRARRGVARTRRRLRQLGVRRRHWVSEQRPAAGWASLTDTEQAAAHLMAEGLTNQRIADQMSISTHTVAFHLRQVFRKLDIRSRVDLARIALEHARPEAARTP